MPAGRLARLGATPDFHHGLLALAVAAPIVFATALYAQSPSTAAGQSPVPAAQMPAAQPSPAPGAAAQPPPPPQEAFTYQPEGRRDPFLNLIGSGSDPRQAGRRAEGPGGLSVSDISVRGIMQSRGLLVAMIAGSDNKTYIVHQGDKLLDGRIKTITPQGLVVIQEVNDPLSLVKQREVSKLLRAAESAKE